MTMKGNDVHDPRFCSKNTGQYPLMMIVGMSVKRMNTRDYNWTQKQICVARVTLNTQFYNGMEGKIRVKRTRERDGHFCGIHTRSIARMELNRIEFARPPDERHRARRARPVSIDCVLCPVHIVPTNLCVQSYYTAGP